ncbi:MAG: hypothetical protein KY395_04695 [Actinobacteria bacterium]|nr:hypothetical protein [Actinomycetota bacterium]
MDLHRRIAPALPGGDLRRRVGISAAAAVAMAGPAWLAARAVDDLAAGITGRLVPGLAAAMAGLAVAVAAHFVLRSPVLSDIKA